jgi:hypothetical protein
VADRPSPAEEPRDARALLPMEPWECDRLTAAHVLLDEAMGLLGYDDPTKPAPCDLTRAMQEVSTMLWEHCIYLEGSAAQTARIQQIQRRLAAALPAPDEEPGA